MSNENQYGFNTLSLHAGQTPDKVTGSRAVPIYQTTSYVFEDTEHAARLFALEEPGNIYTRMMNPTNDVLEQRIAALEGGIGALAVSSGQAAETIAILNIAREGEEIISSKSLYGGTFNLFRHTLPKMGVNVKFAETLDINSYEEKINENTKAIFVETIGNPQLDVPDFEGLASLAHKTGIPLIVDSTFATPYICKPFDYGADIVIHSLTKFIGGHGTSIGGIIVDSGNFNWDNGSFPEMVEPDPSYHGIKYVDHFGPAAYIAKARVQLLRDFGSCLSPFNAFLFLQGLETLSLRMERHCDNAAQIASYLHKDNRVNWVSYPGLPDHPTYQNVQKYLNGSGAIITFGIRGGFEAGKKFIENLNLFSHLANVGDAKSLAIHPASTTHQQLSKEERKMSGLTQDMIRLSIGIEDKKDLINDLDNALNKSSE